MNIIFTVIDLAISIGLIWAIFDMRKNIEEIKNEMLKSKSPKDDKWI